MDTKSPRARLKCFYQRKTEIFVLGFLGWLGIKEHTYKETDQQGITEHLRPTKNDGVGHWNSKSTTGYGLYSVETSR